jgi:HK97 family phage major capsid protein
VFEDSDPSLATVLNEHLLRVLALKLDAALLEGSGTPPEIAGLREIAGQSFNAGGPTADNPEFEQFSTAIALLEAANVPLSRIRIVLHPRNVAYLRTIKANDAGTFQWGPPSAAPPNTLFGVPVFTSSQLSIDETVGSDTDCNSAYIYDVEALLFVSRAPIEIELDRSRLFNYDSSEMRAKLRADLVSPDANRIVRIEGLKES